MDLPSAPIEATVPCFDHAMPLAAGLVYARAETAVVEKAKSLLAAAMIPQLIEPLLKLLAGGPDGQAEIYRVAEQVNVDALQVDMHRVVHGGRACEL